MYETACDRRYGIWLCDYIKGYQALEQAAQGSGWVTIPGGI